MVRAFIVLTFLALAMAYWALSGGAGFEPEARSSAELATTGPDDQSAPDVSASELAMPEMADATPPLADQPSDVPAEPLAPADEPAPNDAATAGDLRRVTGDRVNVRGGPSTSFAVVGQVTNGEVAEVVGEQGEWVHVQTAAGLDGWMAGRFLEPGL